MVNQSYLDYLKKYLNDDQLGEGIRKLEMGIPPQYIVGNVDFYGYIFEVNSNVLIPRFETELLVEKTIFYVRRFFHHVSDLRVLDIGTGSGCIAITLEKQLGCSVCASDISGDALDVARRNAFLLHSNVDFISSDIFSNIDGKYQVIISNPPYIREDEKIDDIVKNNEPSIALFAKEDGLYYYRRILMDVSRYLDKKFIIAFEIGEGQGDTIKKMVNQYLQDVDVKVEKDFSNRDRYVFIFSS